VSKRRKPSGADRGKEAHWILVHGVPAEEVARKIAAAAKGLDDARVYQDMSGDSFQLYVSGSPKAAKAAKAKPKPARAAKAKRAK
jgi:hypothetical protein